LSRRYLPLEKLDAAVEFHENVIGQKAGLRFDYGKLKLASVSSILFIAGAAEGLKPFAATHLTFLVDDIREYERYLPTAGAEILEAVKRVPTGWNMLVRHPDATVVEYVQHGPH